MWLATVTPWELLVTALLGLFAGVIGGMLGIGGSMIMIPGLVFLFGQGVREGFNQHVYQAAAMIANVAVALPAARRHYRANAVIVPVLKLMLPAALLFILIGVAISNLSVFRGDEGGLWLARLLALFLLYEAAFNTYRVAFGEPLSDSPLSQPVITKPRVTAVGAGMGLVGGVLGVGGGVIAVPLQQILLRLPLRSCIANSAAVMCVSATLGAIYKNATLPKHDVPWHQGILLAAMLAPTCWIGGRLGAGLTHSLPVRQVRMAFVALMIVAAVKLAAIPWERVFH